MEGEDKREKEGEREEEEGEVHSDVNMCPPHVKHVPGT